MNAISVCIGNGAYGEVWSLPDKPNAVKLIEINEKDNIWCNTQNAIRELHLLRYKSPYIVNYIEAKYRFGTVELHMERMAMDLGRLIDQNDPNMEDWSQLQVQSVGRQRIV